MRPLLLTVIISAVFITAGCSLHQIKGEVGGIEVEAKTKSKNGKFCPPGQAKKGNC